MNKTELKARRESIRWAYRELEQPATIIVLAERYLREDPLDGVVWTWYGHTLVEMGRYAEADAALKTARGLSPPTITRRLPSNAAVTWRTLGDDAALSGPAGPRMASA